MQLTWYRHGHLVTTSDPALLEVAEVGREDAGTFTCMATNRHGDDSTSWQVVVTGETNGLSAVVKTPFVCPKSVRSQECII